MTGVVVIGIIVVFVGLAVGLYLRQRNMAFEGTVTDKNMREEVVNNTNNQTSGSGINIGGGGNVRHTFTIKVQTDAGKQISWDVSQGKYEIITIGDRVTKRAGTTDIDVTPRTLPTGPPAAPTGPPPTIPSPPNSTVG